MGEVSETGKKELEKRELETDYGQQGLQQQGEKCAPTTMERAKEEPLELDAAMRVESEFICAQKDMLSREYGKDLINFVPVKRVKTRKKSR
jgi:hypothetical protein